MNIRAMDDFAQLRGILEFLPVNETSVVLSNSKKLVEAIKEYALPKDKNIDVLTMAVSTNDAKKRPQAIL
ncbi:hypothetical protein [Campylobacter concisus]|uniref:hypothetical protein n=1 Tax=Campylobacter concisus TaxID=199 RepID=UPI000CD892B3|nr:hypothetical protein [Campylobacter concisus]QPH88901.1 hypothetical protein CVT15_09425 [Campylobacter concisus]